VEAVPADVPLLGDVPVYRVGRRRRWQVVEERGVEHRDVRQVGQRLKGDVDAEHRRRVVQRRQRCQLLELGDQCVVDQCRPVQIRAAVHDAVTHRDQPDRPQLRAGLVEQLERGAQRRLVVGHLVVAADLALTERQARRRRLLTDPLDDTVGQRRTRIGLNQLEFDR
jgi:hypothetical protein